MYTVYGLKDPIDDLFYYIGLTSDVVYRKATHLEWPGGSDVPSVKTWVASVRSAFREPYFEVIEAGIFDKRTGLDREIYWEAYYRAINPNLINMPRETKTERVRRGLVTYYQDPEARRRNSEIQKVAQMRPEVRRKKSVATRRVFRERPELAMAHSLRTRGEGHPKAQITEDAVREMRRLRNEERLPKADIARRFGVKVSLVTDVVLRRTWKHVR